MAAFIRDTRLAHGEIPLLLLQAALPHSCKVLYAVLDTFGKEVFPKIRTVCDRSRMGRGQVLRCLDKLQETGWIKTTRTGRSSFYVLTMPDWAWKCSGKEVTQSESLKPKVTQGESSEDSKRVPLRTHSESSLHINSLIEELDSGPFASGSGEVQEGVPAEGGYINDMDFPVPRGSLRTLQNSQLWTRILSRISKLRREGRDAEAAQLAVDAHDDAVTEDQLQVQVGQGE